MRYVTACPRPRLVFPHSPHCSSARGSLWGSATQGTDELLEKIDDVEKSHYLGGDVQHTHLVRGLDRALLHKVRSEMETSKAESKQAERVKHVRVAAGCARSRLSA